MHLWRLQFWKESFIVASDVWPFAGGAPLAKPFTADLRGWTRISAFDVSAIGK
jgi:hypothetical protein